jgi:predicted HAD superfamily phosphohydrolase YqeG
LVVSFFVVSFLAESVDDFLVVDDFFVVDVLAGAFSGAVVVAVSVLLVLQAPRSPATNRQVME